MQSCESGEYVNGHIPASTQRAQSASHRISRWLISPEGIPEYRDLWDFGRSVSVFFYDVFRSILEFDDGISIAVGFIVIRVRHFNETNYFSVW